MAALAWPRCHRCSASVDVGHESNANAGCCRTSCSKKVLSKVSVERASANRTGAMSEGTLVGTSVGESTRVGSAIRLSETTEGRGATVMRKTTVGVVAPEQPNTALVSNVEVSNTTDARRAKRPLKRVTIARTYMHSRRKRLTLPHPAVCGEAVYLERKRCYRSPLPAQDREPEVCLNRRVLVRGYRFRR